MIRDNIRVSDMSEILAEKNAARLKTKRVFGKWAFWILSLNGIVLGLILLVN